MGGFRDDQLALEARDDARRAAEEARTAQERAALARAKEQRMGEPMRSWGAAWADLPGEVDASTAKRMTAWLDAERGAGTVTDVPFTTWTGPAGERVEIHSEDGFGRLKGFLAPSLEEPKATRDFALYLLLSAVFVFAASLALRLPIDAVCVSLLAYLLFAAIAAPARDLQRTRPHVDHHRAMGRAVRELAKIARVALDAREHSQELEEEVEAESSARRR